MENKTVMELTASIVASAAAKKEMGKDEIIEMIKSVQAELKAIENPPETVVEEVPAVVEKPKNPMSSIKQNEIICLICGTGGFKTLTKHLRQVHQIEPKDYRKQFGIKAGVSLAAKAYVAKRKEIAANSNLGENLKKAREARQANIAAKKAAPVKKAAKKAQEVVVVPE